MYASSCIVDGIIPEVQHSNVVHAVGGYDVGRDGTKGLVGSETVFAIAGPMQTEANETHGVAAKEAFLLVVNT